ncbi:MAG TPA: hypothetical protein VI636_05880 [Candidatus Angelobacter sp.]
MNPTDPQSFFDKWLTAYSQHLHIVRHGSKVDLVQADASKPPLPVSMEKPADNTPVPRKPSSA